MSFAPGTKLGPYEIAASIGAGGMGEIYRARDPRLGREVAVKVLPADVATRPDRLARFEREARSVAALNHPNIVTIHSIEQAGKVRFLTMELVDGETLDRLVEGGGLPASRILDIAIPLADALAAAHGRGVVHRDLKPANVMVTRDGRLKVLDFGLAKLDESDSGESATLHMKDARLTAEGHVLGTPAYMSPEQAEGRATDARSDLFSVGTMLYELATGERPFRGATVIAVLASVLTQRPKPIAELRPDCPGPLAAAIEKCLEKSPSARYASAAELRDALRALKADLAATPSPTSVSGANGSSTRPATPAPILAAIAAHEWETAYRLFQELRESRPLSADELAELAEVALWIGRFDECIEQHEKAFAAYSAEGNPARAARMAMELSSDYGHKSMSSVAQGWMKRAERLLADAPECLEHGYLYRRQAYSAFGSGDYDGALALAGRVREIGERFGSADLRAMGIHMQGWLRTHRGEVREGTALVDEAMAAAMSGEVTPFALGILYCNTMSVCEWLGDYNRAREWNDAAMRWCGGYARSPWPSVCSVHGAKALRQQGRWADAEEAARDALASLRAAGESASAGEASNELGEIALRRGRYDEAEEAFRQAHELGYDPVPGLPLLRLAQGKRDAALRMLERAIGEAANDRLRRAELLTARASVDLAGGDAAAAAAVADVLAEIGEEYESAMYRANAAFVRGAVALARGQTAEATPALREAWLLFRDTGFPYDAARARAALGDAYARADNSDDARLEYEAARRCFVDLGAMPDADAVTAKIDAMTATPAAGPTGPSIAVLPFTNMSPDPNDEFFSDGITEEIIAALAQLPGLKVAARTSCFAFKGKHEDLRSVGDRLGVATVLEGSVRKAGSRLRITAQLIGASDGYHLWSERYDREFADIFAIQDEIAAAIAEKLRVSLGSRSGSGGAGAGVSGPRAGTPGATGLASSSRRTPAQLEAYELFLKGRVLQTRRGASVVDSAACFEKAVALDPTFTEAHAWLADSYRLLGIYGMRPPSEVIPRARAAAERALELDPNQVEAITTLAGIVAAFERDIRRAETLWDRALAVDPSFVRALCERSLNVTLFGAAGRPAEVDRVKREFRRALELDSLNAWAAGMHALALSVLGEGEEAVAQARAAVALDDGNFLAKWALVECLLAMGRYEEGLRAAEPALTMSGRHPYVLGAVAAAHAARGDRDAANAIYEELEGRSRSGYVSWGFRAMTAASAGRFEEARDAARRAVAANEGILYFWKGLSDWAPFRADPECSAILRDAGL